MKKKSSIFFFIILVLGIMLYQSYLFIERGKNDEELYFPIKKISIIRSIAPNDTNFSDLEFLKPLLDSVSIIILGESLHDDYNSFKAKTRLIKFLHQKLNFSLLLFETGRFEIDHLSEVNDDYRCVMWPFWSSNEYSNDLFSYIENSKASNPLIIKGFDIQPITNFPPIIRVEVINNYLIKKNQTIEEYPFLKEYLLRNFKYNREYRNPDSIRNDMRNLIATCENETNTAIDHSFKEYFKNIEEYIKMTQMRYASAERFHLRDSIMAKNIFHILDRENNKKTIIWTSNLHALNNSDNYLQPPPQLQFKTMGDYILQKHPDSHVICFTGAMQIDANRQLLTKASNMSFEHYLHNKGIIYAYIDFKQENNNIPFKMHCNQNLNLSANWSQMCDGIFYIDSILQNNYLP